VAEQVTNEDLSIGPTYPPQSRILDASLYVAKRVALHIFDHALAPLPSQDDIGSLIRARAYRAVYSE
jgi:malate dehydrogenase (oxaloacetate-decarboxylating)(NADP+)